MRAGGNAKSVHKPKGPSGTGGISEKTAMADIFMFVIEEMNSEVVYRHEPSLFLRWVGRGSSQCVLQA